MEFHKAEFFSYYVRLPVGEIINTGRISGIFQIPGFLANLLLTHFSLLFLSCLFGNDFMI